MAFGQNQNAIAAPAILRSDRNKPKGSGQATVVPVSRSTPRRRGVNSAAITPSPPGGRSGAGQFGDVGAHVPRQQPAPAVIAVGAVYPVALFFPRFGRLREFLEGGPRVGNFLDQFQRLLRAPPQIAHADAIAQRLADRSELGQHPLQRQTGPAQRRAKGGGQ